MYFRSNGSNGKNEEKQHYRQTRFSGSTVSTQT